MSEFDRRWHISSFSGGDGCVQARCDDGLVRVRHSRDPQGPLLAFTLHEWQAFVLGVRNGEFDVKEPVEA